VAHIPQSPGYFKAEVFEWQRFVPLYRWRFFKYTNTAGVTLHETDLSNTSPPRDMMWASEWRQTAQKSDEGDGWSYIATLEQPVEAGKRFSLPHRRGYRRRLWTRLIRFSSVISSAAEKQSIPEIPSPYTFHIRNSRDQKLKGGTAISHPESPEIIYAVVYENQRLGREGSDLIWSARFLSGNDWPAFSNESGTHKLPSLSEVAVQWGYVWDEPWVVEQLKGRTDSKGFFYAQSFAEMPRAMTELGTIKSKTSVWCRSRKWRRRMTRLRIAEEKEIAVAGSLGPPPFTLIIRLLRISDTELSDGVKVEISVGNSIVGITDGSEDCAWKNQGEFSVALTSLVPVSLRFTVTQESYKNRHRSGLIGRAVDDNLMYNKLWTCVNRKVTVRLPIYPESNLRSSGILEVELELNERYLFYLSSSTDALSTAITHFPEIDQSPQDYLARLLSQYCKHLEFFRKYPDNVSSWMRSLIPRADGTPFLMATSRSDLADIFSPSLYTDVHDFVYHLFPLSTLVVKESLLQLTEFGLCSADNELCENRGLQVPVYRSLFHIARRVEAIDSDSSLQWTSTLVTQDKLSHTFCWDNEYGYLRWMRFIGNSLRTHAVDVEISCMKLNSEFERKPVILCCRAADDDYTVSWRECKTENNNGSVSRCYSVSDIRLVKSSLDYEYLTTYALDVDVTSFAVLEAPPGATVMITLLSPNGQSQRLCTRSTHSHEMPSAYDDNVGNVRFFLSPGDVCDGDIIASIHICYSSNIAMPHTIGELRVPIRELVRNSLFGSDCSDAPKKEAQSQPEKSQRSGFDDSQLSLNVPTYHHYSLSPPRHAISFTFVKGERLLGVNLDKTSDPYCILQFTDYIGNPVSQRTFKTKSIERNLNPEWKQTVVCGSEYGFLTAAFAHIEIWDKDIVTSNSCLGEVYIPLQEISEEMREVRYDILWSPKMGNLSRTKEASLGSLYIGSKVIYPSTSLPGHSKISCYGEITVSSSLSVPVATSAIWMCRVISEHRSCRMLQDTSLNFSKLFGCIVRRNSPGLRIVPCDSFARPSHGEKYRHEHNRVHPPRKHTSPKEDDGAAEYIRSCKEATKDGIIIPWCQVSDVELVSPHSVIVTAIIHRCFSRETDLVYRAAKVEFLVGPCPAYSLNLLIQESISWVSPIYSVGSCRDDREGDRQMLCEIADAIYESFLYLNHLRSKWSNNISGSNKAMLSLMQRQYFRCSMIINSRKPSYSQLRIAETWSCGLSRHISLLVALYSLIYQCSTLAGFEPSYNEDAIETWVDSSGAAFGCQAYDDANSNPEIIGRQSKLLESDMEKVREFMNVVGGYLLDLILCSWFHLIEPKASTVREEFADRISLEFNARPQLASLLEIGINGCYNRVVSLIGRFVDSGNFEKLSGQQSKLSLIAFVVHQNNGLMDVLTNTLSAIGLRFSQQPKLSVALNIESLLGRFAYVLSSELKLYVSRALEPESMDSPLPWSVAAIDGAVYVGPLPESINNLFLTYLRMLTPMSMCSNCSSLTHILKLNHLIIKAVLNSYFLLTCRLSEVLKNCGDTIGDSLADVSSDTVSDFLYFLCSVANDCCRVSNTHLSLLLKQYSLCLAVTDEYDDNERNLSSELQDDINRIRNELRSELDRVCWTAVELVTKMIFMDIGDLFIDGFESILTESFPLESILTTLEDYFGDLKVSLMPDCMSMMLLSCGHKLVHRYILFLYDYARGIKRVHGYDTSMVFFPVLAEIIRRKKIRGGISKESGGAIKEGDAELQSLDTESVHKVRKDTLFIANMLKKFCVDKYQVFIIDLEFQQLHSLLDVVEHSDSSTDFFQSLSEFGKMCSYEDEALLCAVVLRGMNFQQAKAFVASVISAHKSSSAGAKPISWESCALRYAFTSHRVNADEVEEPSPENRFENLTKLLEERQRGELGHSNLRKLLGLHGPLMGLNNCTLVPASDISHNQSTSSLKIKLSDLQCRGLPAVTNRIGTTYLFLRIGCNRLNGQLKTDRILSCASPKWTETFDMDISTRMGQLVSLVFEIVEVNSVVARYNSLGSCEFDMSHVATDHSHLKLWLDIHEPINEQSALRYFPVISGIVRGTQLLSLKSTRSMKSSGSEAEGFHSSNESDIDHKRPSMQLHVSISWEYS